MFIPVDGVVRVIGDLVMEGYNGRFVSDMTDGSFEAEGSFETIGAMTSSSIQGAANLDGNPEHLSESETTNSSTSKTNLSRQSFFRVDRSWLDIGSIRFHFVANCAWCI